MDAEIPKLGSGIESADCPIWRTAYQLFVRKEKQEWSCPKANHSRSLSIPSAFVLLPEFPHSIPEVGCGQRPQKAINTMPYLSCKKNQKRCIKASHMVIL